MALGTKKDAIVYLLGATKRLMELSNLSEEDYKSIYDMLDQLHKFIEEMHDK